MITTPENLHVSDEDANRYRVDGFWISPVLFDDREITELRNELMRTARRERDFDSSYWDGFEPNYDPNSVGLTHIVNAWRVNARIREVTTLPVLGAIASKLTGEPELRLVHDQLIIKPGQGSDKDADPQGNVGWHQDAAHWTVFNTTDFITAWVALQDTDEANGCVRFARGSNQWGLRPDAHSFANRDLEGLQQKYSHDGQRQWRDTPAVLKAGQASFHSGLTFHGSAANTTSAPRLSVVVNMMPGGTTYNESGRNHGTYSTINSPDGVPGPHVKDGEPCTDPLFPRIWPPAKP
ncbi:MAG: phytanoyl-CoA dioxygenase family protein [Phycisphaeraceae bacterium]|nr:phytanoyl-CoA dioxygenase family protein [Phycisphaeraceae bacterium]